MDFVCIIICSAFWIGYFVIYLHLSSKLWSTGTLQMPSLKRFSASSKIRNPQFLIFFTLFNYCIKTFYFVYVRKSHNWLPWTFGQWDTKMLNFLTSYPFNVHTYMPTSSFFSKFSRKAIRSAPENIRSIWRPFNRYYSLCSWEYFWSVLNPINNCSEKRNERGFTFLLRAREKVPQESKLNCSVYTT